MAGDIVSPARDGVIFDRYLKADRATAKLGFRSRYRIGLARAGDGALRLETASV